MSQTSHPLEHGVGLGVWEGVGDGEGEGEGEGDGDGVDEGIETVQIIKWSYYFQWPYMVIYMVIDNCYKKELSI